MGGLRRKANDWHPYECVLNIALIHGMTPSSGRTLEFEHIKLSCLDTEERTRAELGRGVFSRRRDGVY